MAKPMKKEPVQKGVAKVPVVMQLETLECGAASLCMVMAYYEKWVPLEQLRIDCGVSRDGSKLSNVIKAARKYGLEAKGFGYPPEKLRDKGTFPCIAFWNRQHFIVVDGFRGDRVYVNDPAKGAFHMSMEQFEQGYSNICLLITPTEAFEPGGRRKGAWSFVLKRLQGTLAACALVVALGGVGAMLGIVQPSFLQIFLDRLLTGRNPDWFTPYLVCLSLVIAGIIAVRWGQAVLLLKIRGKLSAMSSATYLWHVLRMPMVFFSQRQAAELAMRQQLNDTISETFIKQLVPLLLNAVVMLLYLIAMLRMSPLLSLVGLGSLALNLLCSRLIAAKRTNVLRVQLSDEGKLHSATVSGINMIETIKAAGAESGYFEKWAGHQAGVNEQTVRFAKLDAYLGTVPFWVSSITSAVVLMLGAYAAMNGQFTAGMLMAFQGLLMGFSAPAEALVDSAQALQEMVANIERVEDVMRYPADVEDAMLDENKDYNKLSGELVIRDLTFGYSPLEPPLIEHFDLHLTPGKRVALVGPSGCGKSTLAKLISGLYKPWGGEILFDGKPIEAIDRRVFTGSVGVVDQDIILFEDSIASNIKMWDSSIEDFEMIMAARDAGLHEMIMQRDHGYGEHLTEGGKNLSGGQRQRLEIARVLAQDPTILVMDEATSALDAETEHEVVRRVMDRGITCIAIAHRLSTIRDCDEIIVLSHGKIVERGTHDELYKIGGAYAQLIDTE